MAKPSAAELILKRDKMLRGAQTDDDRSPQQDTSTLEDRVAALEAEVSDLRRKLNSMGSGRALGFLGGVFR